MLDEVELSPRAAGRLTALFAWARFSVHDVRPEMKDEAIETLEQVQQELAAARGAREAELAGAPREADRPRGRGGLAVSAWAGIVLVLVPGPGVGRRARLARPRARDRTRCGVGALHRAVPGAASAFDAAFAPRAAYAGPAGVPRARRARGGPRDRHGVRRPLPPAAAGPHRSPRGCSLAVASISSGRPQRAQSARRPGTVGAVRPDRPAPEDRTAPGLPLETIERVVDDLERLAWSCASSPRRAAVVLDEVERAVVGKRDRLELVLAGLLADGHVLLEDVPGLAKTLTARSFATVDRPRLLARPVHARPPADGRHRLVDLEPARRSSSSSALGPSSRTSSSPTRSTAPRRRRRRRCSRRCRSDRCRSTGRRTRSSRRSSCSRRRTPSSTRAPTRYPRRSSTGSCCARASATRRRTTSGRCSSGGSSAARRRGRAASRSSTARRCSRCSARSRTSTSTRASAGTSSPSSRRPARARASRSGSSPRGSLALLKLSRCRAALAGRDFVTPDDVKSAAVPALGHRLVLRPELWVQRRTGEDVVRDVLDEVRTPSTERV